MMLLRTLKAALLGLTLVAATAQAGSFRTHDNQLVREGMSRAKVLAILGEPDSKHLESVAVAEAAGKRPVQSQADAVESWIYFARDSFHVERILTLTMKAGSVASVKVEKVREF